MSDHDSKHSDPPRPPLRRDGTPSGEAARSTRPAPASESRGTDTYGCVDWFDYGQSDRRPRPAG